MPHYADCGSLCWYTRGLVLVWHLNTMMVGLHENPFLIAENLCGESTGHVILLHKVGETYLLLCTFYESEQTVDPSIHIHFRLRCCQCHILWGWYNRIWALHTVTHLVLKLKYSGMIRSMPWVLMPWRHQVLPGHQQPWYWLWRINRSLSFMRMNLKYLHHINVKKCFNMHIYISMFSNIMSVWQELLLHMT